MMLMLEEAGLGTYPSYWPKRCQPQADIASSRDLGRVDSFVEVPDRLAPAVLGFRDDG
jgi:hypothetical protein